MYDERFHAGVNVIRGINGSGKTTIAEFIAFALGGDIHKWRKEALLCDYVYAEIVANDAVITLRRRVEPEPRRPMGIFWGPYDAAVQETDAKWNTYPYAQHETTQSFSTVLFRALGLPEVRGQLASKVTMHQVLRLMYVDQLTPSDQLFEHEQFDSPLVRDAVGWLLCGSDDSEFYDVQMKLREAITQRDVVNGELRSIYSLLGGRAVSASDLTDRLTKSNAEREECYAELKRLQREQLSRASANAKQKKAVEAVATELRVENEELLRLNNERAELNLEIADSELFLISLRANLQSLEDSTVVGKLLAETSFELCPACYTPVGPPQHPSLCPLCKSQKSSEASQAKLLRLKQELAQQIAESELLQKRRLDDIDRLSGEISAKASRKNSLQGRYRDLAANLSPVMDPAQAEQYRKLGYLEREVEELQRKLELAQTVEERKRRAERLSQEIKSLEKRKEQLESERHRLQFEARNAVVEATASLIGRDLDREKVFRDARSIDFNFAQNVVLVDGRSNFAASSMVFVKNCFHLALLLASLRKSFFRYPRFLLLDNVEDKGMEMARSHNFQRLVLEMSRASECEHQIILTTSMVAPQLDVPELTVGDNYTYDKKSLRIQA